MGPSYTPAGYDPAGYDPPAGGNLRPIQSLITRGLGTPGFLMTRGLGGAAGITLAGLSPAGPIGALVLTPAATFAPTALLAGPIGVPALSASAGLAGGGIASSERPGLLAVGGAATIAPATAPPGAGPFAPDLSATAVLAAAALPSAETVGPIDLAALGGLTIAIVGVASAESFGPSDLSAASTVAPLGADGSIVLPAPDLSGAAEFDLAGPPTGETFGAGDLSALAGGTLFLAGLASAEAFGAPDLSAVAGVASTGPLTGAEPAPLNLAGAATLSAPALPAAPGPAAGALSALATLTLAGPPHDGALGVVDVTATAGMTISLVGIPSAEGFGPITFDAVGGGPVLLPDLLGAIAAYWQAAGLATTIGPLALERARPGQVMPFVVADLVDEHLPGETAEDRPVDVYLAVMAGADTQAKALGKQVFAALDPGPRREPLAWQGGNEVFNVRDDSTLDRLAGKAKGAQDVWRYHIHYVFWISGEP